MHGLRFVLYKMALAQFGLLAWSGYISLAAAMAIRGPFFGARIAVPLLPITAVSALESSGVRKYARPGLHALFARLLQTVGAHVYAHGRYRFLLLFSTVRPTARLRLYPFTAANAKNSSAALCRRLILLHHKFADKCSKSNPRTGIAIWGSGGLFREPVETNICIEKKVDPAPSSSLSRFLLTWPLLRNVCCMGGPDHCRQAAWQQTNPAVVFTNAGIARYLQGNRRWAACGQENDMVILTDSWQVSGLCGRHPRNRWQHWQFSAAVGINTSSRTMLPLLLR